MGCCVVTFFKLIKTFVKTGESMFILQRRTGGMKHVNIGVVSM